MKFGRNRQNIADKDSLEYCRVGHLRNVYGFTPFNERKRNTRTREVKGIAASVNLNRALWSLAEKMAALKK